MDYVQLSRPKIGEADLNQSLYGVTQFGELLLTESALYRAIDLRCRATRSSALEMISKHVPLAQVNFSLNSNSKVFALRVPRDVNRRDQLLKLLHTGDAAEEIYCISELAGFRDAVSHQAVRDALECKEATPVYGHSGSVGDTAWDVQSVRGAAAEAIRFIEANR